MAFASEEQLGGLIHNRQTNVPLWINLNELGFPQPPTPIKTNNSDDEGIANATVRKKGPGQWI